MGQQSEGTGVLMAADFDERDGCYGEFLAWQAAGAAAEQQERQHSKDIWQDQWALQLLQSGKMPAGLDRRDKGRVAHRARLYSWQDGTLYRRPPDGSLRKVPEPGDRVELVQHIHEQCGHYGVKRTCVMVAASLWRRTLHADVAEVIRRCTAEFALGQEGFESYGRVATGWIRLVGGRKLGRWCARSVSRSLPAIPWLGSEVQGTGVVSQFHAC